MASAAPNVASAPANVAHACANAANADAMETDFGLEAVAEQDRSVSRSPFALQDDGGQTSPQANGQRAAPGLGPVDHEITDLLARFAEKFGPAISNAFEDALVGELSNLRSSPQGAGQNRLHCFQQRLDICWFQKVDHDIQIIYKVVNGQLNGHTCIPAQFPAMYGLLCCLFGSATITTWPALM